MDGRKIAVGGQNSGSALSANLIFGFKGIAFEPAHLAGDQAILALRRGEVDAIFMVLGKPASILQGLAPSENDDLHFIGLEGPKGLPWVGVRPSVCAAPMAIEIQDTP